MLAVSIAIHNPDKFMFKTMLESLFKYTPEMKRLIVIDNCSQEDFSHFIKQLIPQDREIEFTYLLNEANEGFGAAHNRAFTFNILNDLNNEIKFFAVLNDDIEFFETWSTPMINVMESDKDIAQVGMKTGVCNWITQGGRGVYKDTETPDYIEGSCFIVRVSAVGPIGLFDSRYKVAYFEDTDLSLRLKDLGYKIATVGLNWKHYRATTSKKVDLDLEGHLINNEYQFKKRWHSYVLNKTFGPCIVVKREGSFGDVFLVEPILQALKKKYSDSDDPKRTCVILLMSKDTAAIQNSINIDGFVAMHSPVPCDKFIDLDYAYEVDFTKHIVRAYADKAGVYPEAMIGRVYATEEDHKVVDKVIDIEDYITVDISSTWAGKEWDREEFKRLVRHLKSAGHKVVAVGKTSEYKGDFNFDRNFANLFSLIQTALILSKAKAHVGHEGVLGHFCQAMNVPHIILYGCTSPKYVSDTLLPTWRGVVSPVVCQGCRHRMFAGTKIICDRKYECMKRIPAELVYETVRTVL